MKASDWAGVVAVSLVAAVAVVYAATAFGVPGLTPRPPRNTQAAGQTPQPQ